MFGAEVDRSSKLSVISDVSRESEGLELQPRENLLLLVVQLRHENETLRQQQEQTQERLKLLQQQLLQQDKPQLQDLFELQNTVFELKTKLSGCKVTHMEELNRVHQMHTKEKGKLQSDYEQRLKLNKETYNKQLNEIKLMLSSNIAEKDIIKEQQEKLGLCLEEIKNLEKQQAELEAANRALKKDLEKAGIDALNEQRKNRHGAQQLQSLEERIAIKTDQIRVIQSELNIQKDFCMRLEGQNHKLKEQLQLSEQLLRRSESLHVGDPASNEPDYSRLFQETKKLNEALTTEVQRCYAIIRQLETEREEKSRVRDSTSSQQNQKHKSMEEECFQLKKELSDAKIKLTNALTENRYLLATIDTLKKERPSIGKRNSGVSQADSEAELEALIREQAVQKELAAKDNEMMTLMNELTSRTAALNELSKQLIDSNETIDHLRRKLLEVQTANLQLITHSQHSIHIVPPEASEEIANLRAENNRYKEQYSLLAQEHQRVLNSPGSKVLQANEQLERLQIDLQEVNSWNQQLQQQQQTYKQQRDAFGIERDELLVERTIFVQKIQQLQQENDTYRKACEKVLEDRNQLFSQKGQLELELANIKQAIPRHVESRVSSTEKQVQTLNEQNDELKAALHTARAEKQSIEEQYREQQDTQALLEEKIELLKGLKEEADRKRKLAESAGQEAVSRLAQQQSSLSQYEEELRVLRPQLAARKNDTDKLLQEYEQIKSVGLNQVQALQGRVQQLLAQLAAQKGRYEESTKLLFDEQTQRYHQLNQSTLRLENDLKRLREDTGLQRNEIQLVNRQKGELFAKLQRTRQELAACQDLLQKTQQQMHQANSKADQFEQYVKELELKCSMTEQLNVQLQQQQQEGVDPQQYQSLKSELHSVKQGVEQLSRNLQSVELEKENLVRELYSLRRSNNDITFSSNLPVRRDRESAVTSNTQNYMYFKPPTTDHSTKYSVAPSPLKFEQLANKNSGLAPQWEQPQQVPVRDRPSPTRSKVTEINRHPTEFVRSAVGSYYPQIN